MKLATRLKTYSGAIEVVPLIDVLFLLLIFFLLSSTLVFQPGIAVELPQAKSSTLRAAEKIVVTITRSGDRGELLFFNDNPVEWDDLERQLGEMVYMRQKTAAQRRTENGDGIDVPKPEHSSMIVLRADTGVPYGQIVRVMSLARSQGLGVYLATDTPHREAGTGTFSLPGTGLD